MRQNPDVCGAGIGDAATRCTAEEREMAMERMENFILRRLMAVGVFSVRKINICLNKKREEGRSAYARAGHHINSGGGLPLI